MFECNANKVFWNISLLCHQQKLFPTLCVKDHIRKTIKDKSISLNRRLLKRWVLRAQVIVGIVFVFNKSAMILDQLPLWQCRRIVILGLRWAVDIHHLPHEGWSAQIALCFQTKVSAYEPTNKQIHKFRFCAYSSLLMLPSATSVPCSMRRAERYFN